MKRKTEIKTKHESEFNTMHRSNIFEPDKELNLQGMDSDINIKFLEKRIKYLKNGRH